MKIKNILFLIAVVTTLNVFSQNQNTKTLYTFGGKSGNCTMTWDEFKKCKKELTPIDKSLKINSFNISILVVSPDGKDSTYTDFSNTGNAFSSQANETFDILISGKHVSNKILIEEVQIAEGDKIIKVPGMVITLK